MHGFDSRNSRPDSVSARKFVPRELSQLTTNRWGGSRGICLRQGHPNVKATMPLFCLSQQSALDLQKHFRSMSQRAAIARICSTVGAQRASFSILLGGVNLPAGSADSELNSAARNEHQ
jgi:hypothetical protein